MAPRLLVPVDGNDQSLAAASYVSEHFPEATVLLLHVIDPSRASYGASAGLPTSSEAWFESERERAEQTFETVREAVPDIETETDTVVGQPAREIVDYAEDGFDGIVMGSHGRTGVSRVLLGSVAETVVRRAAVPVTVVR